MVNLRLGDIKESLPKGIIKKFKRCFKDINLYPKNYEFLISKIVKRFKKEQDFS